MTEPLLLALCAVLAGAVVALAVALRRQRREAAQGLAAFRAEQAAVERRLAALEAPRPPDGLVTGASAPPSSTSVAGEYVITRIGSPVGDELEPVDPPDARLFADIVLRETVVKAASFAHGVRRGLSPEIRNKMWFEMRREVRRARKQRRADLKAAQRDWKARQRAALDEDDAA
jgi:hypothetical protein